MCDSTYALSSCSDPTALDIQHSDPNLVHIILSFMVWQVAIDLGGWAWLYWYAWV
jgi:hypothetical protein